MPSPADERVRRAYEILAGIPAKRFVHDLEWWYLAKGRRLIESDGPRPSAHSCRTLACGAGWLALHPEFCRWTEESWHDWCRRYFGSQWKLSWLFAARDNLGAIEFHRGPESNVDLLSDKQLLLYRLRLELRQDPQAALEGALKDGI